MKHDGELTPIKNIKFNHRMNENHKSNSSIIIPKELKDLFEPEDYEKIKKYAITAKKYTMEIENDLYEKAFENNYINNLNSSALSKK